MKRTRLYKLIIAALVIINVVILILFFTGGPGHRPPKSGDLAQKLGIEGKKEVTITNLESDHHKAKRKLMDKDRKLHEELFSKLGTDEDVSELQEEIEENFAEIEKMTYDFFNEVAKLCSDEQKEELKKTIYRAFRQMKGPKR
jgi:peptidoglycan hydrolase CwlO-like protein